MRARHDGAMRRPSPALVIALIALFVSLGGTGYAALTITGRNVKNRSLTGADVKRDSLGGAEIREARLGTVPRAAAAARADHARGADHAATSGRAASADRAGHAASADRAASAQSADTLAGHGPGDFARAADDLRLFATAQPGATTTIVTRGPFTIDLQCITAYGGNPPQPLARAAVRVHVAEPVRSSLQTGSGEPETGIDTLPAGTTKAILATGTAPPEAGGAFKAGGGYFDARGGRTLDISARARVGLLGTAGCSAVVFATFGGL